MDLPSDHNRNLSPIPRVFSGRDGTKPTAAASDQPIDLMVSVRGEEGQSTVFSLILDVLEVALESEESEAGEAASEIDRELVKLSEADPEDLETLVAATVFAFLRDDWPSEEHRLNKLLNLEAATSDDPNPEEIALWLVARYALQYKETRSVGEVLAERGLAAGGEELESEVREAIISERAGI